MIIVGVNVSFRLYWLLIRRIPIAIFLASPMLHLQAADTEFSVYAEPNRTDSWEIENDIGAKITGTATTLVRTLFDELGYTANIKLLPWPRVLHSVQSEPNSFAFSLTRTRSREDEFHWIGVIRPISYKLWTIPSRLSEFPSNLELLKNKKILVDRGHIVTDHLSDLGFNNLVYSTTASNSWELLMRKRIDFIAYSDTGIQNFLENYGQDNDAVAPVVNIDNISTALYLVMNKDSDPELVKQFTTAYQNLIDSGIYREIIGPASEP